MHRPTIKASMLAIFAAMTVMMGLFAITSLMSLTKVHLANDALSTQWLPSVQAARDIQLSMESTRVAYAGHVSASTALEKSTAEELIKKAQAAFKDAVERYRPFVDTERETQLIGLVDKAYGQYVKFGENMLELSNNNDVVMASSVLSRNMKMVAGVAGNSINELVKLNVTGATDSIGQSQATYDVAVKIVYGLIAVVLVLTLAAMLYTLRGITLPIQRLTRAMSQLATGNTDTAIPFAGRKDELGSMAGAVAIFREALIATKTLEDEAETNRKRSELERNAAQAKAESDAAERLAMATSGLGGGLRRLAEGDLSVQLNEPFTPEFEALRHDFHASVRQLSETLVSIADGVGTIDNGAREISRGTDDLSRRTEQQAASLEQTAAALDQITVNVTTSANRTNEARTVAGQANSTAVRSAEVVANAVNAMHRIEGASSQISNIIGVIDEIAFQTNLLALNAGVEAARAGDAGKGFAVVAQEVRELAQRSARAAKEIKELIHNSSVEVAAGVKLVGETGDVLRQIEGYIVTINDHMEAIASAAREQSTGLGEVNTAVNQMDQVTQSNAAMVEETSAASLSLSNEVTHLRQMIGRFNLGRDVTIAHASQSLRQVAATMAEPRRAPEPVRQAGAEAPRKVAAAGGHSGGDDWQEF